MVDAKERDNSVPRVKVLYLFPSRSEAELESVRRGDIPSERFYGVVELQQRGWSVQFTNAKSNGVIGRVRSYLRHHGIHLIDVRTILAIRSAGVVVVKDDFSLMVSVVSWLLRTRLVYLDSMFEFPTIWWKRWAAVLSIKLADHVVGYSHSQIDRWCRELQVPYAKFTALPYTLDMGFYAPNSGDLGIEGDSYILAVGRDMGRDFATLVEAANAIGVKLKLVTLPYLLKDIDHNRSDVEILQHLSYPELFSLYRGAAAVVVPLNAGIDYPSGIRAMLEAMVLAKPIVATRTPALVEYVDAEDPITFVRPNDSADLKHAILKVMQDYSSGCEALEKMKEKVIAKFCMDQFVTGFELILRRVALPK